MCLVNTAGLKTVFRLLKCLWLLLFNIQDLMGERERKARREKAAGAWAQTLHGRLSAFACRGFSACGDQESSKGLRAGSSQLWGCFLLSLTQAGAASALCASLLSPGQLVLLCLEPTDKGWGGGGEPLAPGSSGENQLGASLEPAWSQHPEPAWSQPGASTQSQAQPWGTHSQIFVVDLVSGSKQLVRGQGGVLEGDSTAGLYPWGQEIILVMTASRALCAPRPGTVMEMGCSSPTSLQAACGAHDHDRCDAGCHLEEVTHLVLHGPTLTSPHHCPHCGGRRGLTVEPQLVCSNSSNHCMCADEVGAPPVPRGLRGDSRTVLGRASAALTQQLFLLSQQVQPCAGPCAGVGTHTPLGPGHSSGGMELVGTSQTTPKLTLPCRARDL